MNRPKLSGKTKLKLDKQTGQMVLLYPERGLVLSRTAADIAALCDGERTLDEIVSTLAEKYQEQTKELIAQQTKAFLGELEERGLLEQR